jgi:hypothetical protein
MIINHDPPGDYHEIVAEGAANKWDKDHCIAVVDVDRHEYDVMCGQLEEYYTLQDTIDELLQKRAQTQT